MNYIIGVDIGTTHTKAVVTSTTGEVLYEDKAHYPILQPSRGFSEQNPVQIFEAVLQVMNKVLTRITIKKDVIAVCFSAAMHGIMAINKYGVPLTNLYTWADIRANKYARGLKDTEKGKLIYEETGTAIHPMSPLCKIAWIRQELPQVFIHTYKFISIKEYVFYRLFNCYIVDYSIASATGLFNNSTFKWNDESLVFAGITADHLSEPVPTNHREVLTNSIFTERFALNKEVPFIIGASDGCLAILGSGAMAPNEAALTIGTSGAIRKLNSQPMNDKQGRLFAYVLEDKMFVCGGASNNGGIVLKWFAENILSKTFSSDEAFSWFMQNAATAPLGSGGLIFLPYIYGERSPVWDADARGVFLGMNSTHTSCHFMRAILEGISFSLYQILQAMEESGTGIDTIYASGGFIASDFWLQLLSDIFNKKVIVSHAADASAMGAIFLAMHTLGFIKDWEEIKSLVLTSAVFYPDNKSHLEYNKNFHVFSSLYKKLAPDFASLAEPFA